MRTKSSKKVYGNKIKQFTAFVPKTLKATQKISRNISIRLNSLFRNTTLKIKNSTKNMDKKISQTITSLSKRKTKKSKK